MSTRRTLPAVVALAFALFFFGLGNYLGARQNADTEAQFAALRAELSELRGRDPLIATGTAGRLDPANTPNVDAIVACSTESPLASFSRRGVCSERDDDWPGRFPAQ